MIPRGPAVAAEGSGWALDERRRRRRRGMSLEGGDAGVEMQDSGGIARGGGKL